MTILLDAYNIARSHGTGVATYGRNLARAAAGLGFEVNLMFGTRAGHSRKQPLLNEIALAEGDDGQSDPRKRRALALPGQVAKATGGVFGTRQAREVSLSGEVILPPALGVPGARYWHTPQLYELATAAFRATGRMTRVALPGTDIAHWTYPLPVKTPGAANVYTLHDLVPLRLPYTTADHKRHYLALCQRIAREADHILTVSEHSRADIIRILGVEENRVTNLYQSTDIARLIESVSPEQIAQEVEGLLGVGMREYYLFFGALEPKKNLARLLEAHLMSGSRHPLVIVGAPGWGSERDVALLKQLAELDTEKRIKWLGYLPRQTLATAIAGARAVMFPSLYEGFGLPVLEAMSLGTPVITSATSSLPEVAGEAAVMIDPYDVRSIAWAIKALDDDDSAVAEMGQRGLLQAERFSADAYRQRLGEFYAQLTGTASPLPHNARAAPPIPITKAQSA
ncbi:glycosyltransferase family 1 protein [uncultured Erythrobacter sp.]|uniref:glycosyltransferase family 4 protein n=1 Tax=uncultured Erythrobacter sp. TaxID=263913 RepID=UPI00265A7F04|nr:glycosyltransferase family 1 protein [uncultured Erythrobacter sp.]